MGGAVQRGTCGTSASTCTSPRYMVAGFLVAGVYARAWLRGSAVATCARGCVVPLTVARSSRPCRSSSATGRAATVAERQPVKLATIEGLQHTDQGRAAAHRRLVSATTERSRAAIEIPRSVVAARPPRPERARCRGSTRSPPADRPAGQRGALRISDDGRHRHVAALSGRLVSLATGGASGACRDRRGSTALVVARGAAVLRRPDLPAGS